VPTPVENSGRQKKKKKIYVGGYVLGFEMYEIFLETIYVVFLDPYAEKRRETR
jgi:hypothetical protein